MKKNIRHNLEFRPDKQEGYMLILTVLIISIALAISLTLFSITLKEFLLSSFTRESGRAFTAADAGLECGLYWDRGYQLEGLAYSLFATSNAGIPAIRTNPADPLTGRYPVSGIAPCGEVADIIDVTAFSAGGAEWVETLISPTRAETTFKLHLTNSAGACKSMAVVQVIKNLDDTIITSEGFNSCDEASTARTGRTLEIRTNI